MIKTTLYLLVILCLVLREVSATKDKITKSRIKTRDNGGLTSRKADIPTAEQILGKLLGSVKKNPDQQAVSTAPQTIPLNYPPSTSQTRSPYKSVFGSLPLIPTGSQGATPQTEEYPGAPQAAAAYPPGLPLPAPPPGYHYGSPRKRPRYREDEYRKDDGRPEDDEEEEEDPPPEDEDNPADEEYHDQRFGIGRGRGRGRGLGRNLGRRNRQSQGCNCICWKGIKPHIQWVKVPVCYKPCGVCCPKHEEQPACACICHDCHPCCHCCHSCCCHHPCHCCHCCHCCRRSMTLRPPFAAPKLKKLKGKTPNKKNKIKKKTSKKAKKTTKRKL